MSSLTFGEFIELSTPEGKIESERSESYFTIISLLLALAVVGLLNGLEIYLYDEKEECKNNFSPLSLGDKLSESG